MKDTKKCRRVSRRKEGKTRTNDGRMDGAKDGCRGREERKGGRKDGYRNKGMGDRGKL